MIGHTGVFNPKGAGLPLSFSAPKTIWQEI